MVCCFLFKVVVLSNGCKASLLDLHQMLCYPDEVSILCFSTSGSVTAFTGIPFNVDSTNLKMLSAVIINDLSQGFVYIPSVIY